MYYSGKLLPLFFISQYSFRNVACLLREELDFVPLVLEATLGLKIEEEEKKKAKERQLSGLNNQDVVLQNFAERENGNTRDAVAEAVGFGSGEQYRKAKYIGDNADPELIKQ